MKPLHTWILVAVAGAGIAAATWFARGGTHAAAAAPEGAQGEPIAQVTVALARQRELLDTLNAFGEVSPGQLAGLSFPRAGQVTELSVLPGDRVAKGAVLATLTLDPGARETYVQAGTALAAARREADRLRQLLALQLATQSQVDAAEKAASDAASALKALDALGGNAATNTLTAPFDSVVAGVPVAQGDRVQAGATILQLARTDSLRVQIGIDPAQSRRVRPGTPATLVPIAITSDHPTPIAVTVASVQDMVDPKTQLVNAIVSLPRQVGVQLVPGMKVRAALQVGKRTALAVPRDAVLSDSQGDYVYQVSGGKAHRVPVSKQLEADGYVGIAGLRDPALPVVTVGNYELQDGMAVKATP